MRYRVVSSETGEQITKVFSNEQQAEKVAERLAINFPGHEYWVEESNWGKTWRQVSSWRLDPEDAYAREAIGMAIGDKVRTRTDLTADYGEDRYPLSPRWVGGRIECTCPAGTEGTVVFLSEQPDPDCMGDATFWTVAVEIPDGGTIMGGPRDFEHIQ